MGNLTRDPEFKNIGTTNVCNFGIAINRKTKNGEDTTFVEVSSFGKTADNIAKYFQKGKPILIEGRLQLDQWRDTNTGQQVTKLKVVAERFNFCGGKQGDGQSQGQNQGQQRQNFQPNYDTQNTQEPTQSQNRPASPFV